MQDALIRKEKLYTIHEGQLSELNKIVTNGISELNCIKDFAENYDKTIHTS